MPLAVLAGGGCPTTYRFDFSLTTGASFYAQLVGLLAGFGFAAVVLVVDRAPREIRGVREDELIATESALAALIMATVSLIVATLLYATVSSERTFTDRLAVMNLMASFAACVAIFVLFYGVVWIVQGTALDWAGDAVARIVASLVPAVIFIYLLVSMVDEVSFERHYSASGTTLVPSSCSRGGRPRLHV